MKLFNRVGITAVLVVGALYTGGVADAKPQPVHRGRCVRVGATALSRGVTVRCTKTVKGKKMWRVVVPATSTTSTSSTTTTVAVVVPSVSLTSTMISGGTYPKAAVVTTNVAGKVYFIEGASTVKTVSDITSAPINRWASAKIVAANTPTTITFDVGVLINGYYRVYVANNQGVLSAAALNKVTISITRISNVAVTTTTLPLACAAGGICVFGDTGPGGGIVFYVHAAGGTFTCGAARASRCTYLEAAPTNWLIGTTGDPAREWATGTNQSISVGSTSFAIGAGYANSLLVVAQVNNVAASSAAALAREYSGGSKTDWFLPSKDELNELCKYARQQTTGTGTVCATSGPLRPGFSASHYWSSSERVASDAWDQHFNFGSQANATKDFALKVRPVRAF